MKATTEKSVLELVSVNDLARDWRVSRSTVVRLLDAARVEPLFLGASRRYRRVDITRYLESLQREQSS